MVKAIKELTFGLTITTFLVFLFYQSIIYILYMYMYFYNIIIIIVYYCE